jgi:hypothetical protein
MVRPLKFWLALLALATAFSRVASAQTECDAVRGLCMAGCDSGRTAARCIQRCDGAKRRCSLSGSFVMQGAGYLLLHDMRLDQSIRRELHEHPTPIKRSTQ